MIQKLKDTGKSQQYRVPLFYCSGSGKTFFVICKSITKSLGSHVCDEHVIVIVVIFRIVVRRYLVIRRGKTLFRIDKNGQERLYKGSRKCFESME
jgi:hypothetical protein